MNGIRYEPVFGDQTWFDDGPDDAEMMAIYALRFKRWYKLQDGECYFYLDKEQSWERCSNGYPGLPLLAQRRIIRTPVWTKADQQAGKLPPVWARVLVSPHVEAVVTAVNTKADVFSVQCDDQQLDVLRIDEILPIETDAERQQREREEWCSKALDSAGILSGMQHYELKRLGEYIGSIHDALLSGKLKMPEVKK